MAKEKYADWLTEEGLLLLGALASDGLSDSKIARKIGVASSTLLRWKAQFPKIDGALKRGRGDMAAEVESALLEKARSGSVTAMIFWLKNRCPDRWRDKPVDELAGGNVVVHIVSRKPEGHDG